MKYNTFKYKILSILSFIIAKIKIGRKCNNIPYGEIIKISEILKNQPSIILTKKTSYASSRIVSALSKLKTGSWSTYTHAAINIDGETVLESSGRGVAYSTVGEVLDHSRHIAIIVPKRIDASDWNIFMDEAKSHAGKPYDNLFDLDDDSRLFCTELVLLSLKQLYEHEEKYKALLAEIELHGNLTPQMLRDSQDFIVIYEY